MKAIVCSMILLCALPADAAWNFSWDFAKPYLSMPAMPELPSIKPYVGWVFGTTCLLASIVSIAWMKNNVKYQIAQAEEDTVKRYEDTLGEAGVVLEKKNNEISKITIKGVTFNQHISLALDTIPTNCTIFMKDESKKSLLKIVRRAAGLHQLVLDKSMLSSESKMSLRFKEGDNFYGFKSNVKISTLIDNQMLEKI